LHRTSETVIAELGGEESLKEKKSRQTVSQQKGLLSRGLFTAVTRTYTIQSFSVFHRWIWI